MKENIINGFILLCILLYFAGIAVLSFIGFIFSFPIRKLWEKFVYTRNNPVYKRADIR